MGFALQDLFSFRNVSQAIESVKTGIPDRLPPVFSTLKEDVYGNETTFHTFYGDRRLVQRTEYGAPSRATSKRPVGQKPLILASFASHVLAEQELLLRLRQVNDLMAQQKGADFIERSVRDHKTRYENNRIAHQVQMLDKGAYWYDANGNLLQNSTGAVVTVDFGIPAGNKGQAGGIIAQAWSDPTADAFNHVEALKRKAVSGSGRPLKWAFYGINVPGYIYKNNSFKQYFQFNQQYYQQFASNPGAIPDGFLGIDKWFPMRDVFFEREDGTQVFLFGNDDLTLTPEIDKNVYTLYEGSVICPTKLGVEQTVDAALASVEIKYGMGGYSVVMLDPINIKMVLFDNMLPTWKNGIDLYPLTVAF